MSDVPHVSSMVGDAFARVRQDVLAVLDGIDEKALHARPGPDANSIAWLVWHLTRVQDDHLAELAGHDQRWTAEGWHERFALPYDAAEIGYGHSTEQVAALRTTPDLLRGYHEAVHQATAEVVASLTADDLDRVVDRNWDPPVTVAVRIVSVVNDSTEHAGQAAYVRGLVGSWGHPDG